MAGASPPVDSASVGDPSRFLGLEALRAGLEGLRPPRDEGRVAHLLRRGDGGLREAIDEASLVPGEGMPGDAWGRRTLRKMDAQIATMQVDVATLLANGQPLALFGDNLFLELHLSEENLPPGSRLRAGGALLEVTPMPHDGCRKFASRFGQDALRFVSGKELRHLNLRGIYLRAVEPGRVRVGDAVRVVSRGPATASAGAGR